MNSQDNFRDHIATVDESGKRKWIYPKKPKGTFYNARTLVAVVLLAFLFSGPFITIDGQPILLLNLIERKFIIFGLAFWPQDFHLFLLLMVSFLLMIVTFTSIFGRIWCGWACPQTIFMELVFRKIEYWIEGDAAAQKKLDDGKGSNYVLKKGAKHLIFYLLSFLIANTFLAYVIGIDALYKIISEPISEHVSGFVALQIFTLLFYGVFARFREQACVIVCPYGRWQSVMVDDDTIAVTYDFKRGESRGHLTKEDKQVKLNPDFIEWDYRGDCIDCHQCVDVCPTGIDIRDGIQLECVNCTACMDACDSIMTKIDRPKGLIKYSSYSHITQPEKKIFTGRIIAYLVVLAIVTGVLIQLLMTRPDTEAVILRQPGTLFQKVSESSYSNMYQLKVINKTFTPMNFTIKLLSPKGVVNPVGSFSEIPSQGISEGRFFTILNSKELNSSKIPLIFGIYIENKLIIDPKKPIAIPIIP